MTTLLSLHKRCYQALSSQETPKDRELEFNKLISEYELAPEGIADYLLLIKDKPNERSKLIHKLIDNYEYAEAILVICQLKKAGYGKLKK